MAGGIVHIANHAFSKITLFFCAGSLYYAAHKTEISQLSEYRQKNALDNGGIFYRIAEHDRGAAGRRIYQQMVPGLGLH